MRLAEQKRLESMSLEEIQDEIRDKIFDAIESILDTLYQQGRIKTNSIKSWVAIYAIKMIADRWIK